MNRTSTFKAGAAALLAVAAIVGFGEATTPASAAVPRAAGFMQLPAAQIKDCDDYGSNFTVVLGNGRRDRDSDYRGDRDRYSDNTWYQNRGGNDNRDWRGENRDGRGDNGNRDRGGNDRGNRDFR